MSSHPDQVPTVRALQILTGAMMIGLVVFGVVALFVGQNIAKGPPETANMLLLVLGVMAVGMVIGYGIFRKAVALRLGAELAETSDGERRRQLCQGAFGTTTLIRSAMTEGWGLFGIVIFLVTGNMIGLLAGVWATVLLLVGMPTEYRYEDFVARFETSNPFMSNSESTGL